MVDHNHVNKMTSGGSLCGRSRNFALQSSDYRGVGDGFCSANRYRLRGARWLPMLSDDGTIPFAGHGSEQVAAANRSRSDRRADIRIEVTGGALESGTASERFVDPALRLFSRG